MNRIKKQIPGRLPEAGGMKKRFRVCAATALSAAVLLALSPAALAASGGDPIAVVNNLSDIIFGLIRAIGLILLGFGIVQVGMSLKSHDPSQRANGFLTLAGGILITFTKEILDIITG
jgi:hypothetical protein